MIVSLPELNWSPHHTWQFEVDTEHHVLNIFRYRIKHLVCNDDEPAFGRVYACSVKNPNNYPPLLTMLLKQMKKEPRVDPTNVAAAIISIQNAFVMANQEDSND